MIQDMVNLEQTIQASLTTISQWDVTNGIRGGSLILLVGAFEKYIKDSIEESMGKIKNHRPRITFDNLPAKLQITSMFETMRIAINGKSFEKVKEDITRFPNLISAGQLVSNKEVNPDAFGDLFSNPNPSRVNTVYTSIGIHDIFSKIRIEFLNTYPGTPTINVTEFIKEKLEEVLEKRNSIAHTADANMVTSTDLTKYIEFIETLAKSLDVIIEDHIHQIILNRGHSNYTT